MLSSEEIIQVVAAAVKNTSVPVVVDPVHLSVWEKK
jgi:hydroxymethylpyrimidine/phosphomethylpyrimidine kinase